MRQVTDKGVPPRFHFSLSLMIKFWDLEWLLRKLQLVSSTPSDLPADTSWILGRWSGTNGACHKRIASRVPGIVTGG